MTHTLTIQLQQRGDRLAVAGFTLPCPLDGLLLAFEGGGVSVAEQPERGDAATDAPTATDATDAELDDAADSDATA